MLNDKEALSERLFYSIKEASKITGIKPYVLRYWEKEFSMLKPKREKGRRLYRRQDLAVIMRIKELLYEKGFKISGAKSLLKKEMKEEKETAKPSLDKERVRKRLKELLEILQK